MELSDLIILLVIAKTTILSYFAGRFFGRVPLGRLRAAVWHLVEICGAFIVFYGLNVAIGLAAVFTIRFLLGYVVTLYLAANVLLLVLSAVQAVLCVFWWRGGRS